MVRKLLKHEMNAFTRSMLPMEVILLGIAVLTRFIQIFETESSAYNIVRTSAIIAFVISIVVCLIMSVAVSIRRFYTNMFTSEGYLTMTLPVTAEQHIFAKLLVSIASLLITLLTVTVSVCIATLGDVLAEVCKAVGYIFGEWYDALGGHLIGYIFEIILLALVAMASQYLLFYACISIGQTARKNRVLAAFGVYFAYYIVTQILGTILIIVVAANPQWLSDMARSMFEWAEKHQFAAFHILFLGITAFNAVMSGLWFLVSRYIIKNRLNLE